MRLGGAAAHRDRPLRGGDSIVLTVRGWGRSRAGTEMPSPDFPGNLRGTVPGAEGGGREARPRGGFCEVPGEQTSSGAGAEDGRSCGCC